ncbi:putative WRKY transcription factor 41 [Dichanthelium oligosanthes]|uniref:Putative WRKY transcription factor 41 n=1 Tax=Dichanthelium oligosanthes TaxID=888268 RepID=A0A1E5V0M8_9POAL|nr:putative WRKY transcription factor 41 [Dichanthelium oligosanthes]
MAEGGENGGRARLVSELGRVQDLVRQLELLLHAPSDAASVELGRRLIHQIVALTDRSIGMARATDLAAHFLPAAAQQQQTLSGAPSPLSDAGSDQAFRASPKKRKATARWTSQQARVSAAGGGAEGPADDGHSWRKYGQKDILGAKHPRAYYRCTHRNSQNCLATKQVQRTDDDPTLFDVVYHGEHTCRPSGSGSGGGARRAPQHNPHAHPQQHNPHAQSALQGLAARLTVATAATDAVIGGAAALPPMTPESCPARGASSPWSLASPVGSDSYGCPQGVSPCPVPGYRDWGSDGDLQEVVSAAAFAAVSHLPALDNEYMPLECFAFDQSFDMDGGAMPSLFYP